MTVFDEAYEFAKKAHEGQKDKAGNDYILHPLWVADHCVTPEAKIVGLLHDTVEDTGITLDEIEEKFGKAIRDGVDGMTRREGESYLDFVSRAMKNPLSREVKKMDIRHNMDLSRKPEKPSLADFSRMEEKYIPAYRLLTGHDLTLKEQFDTSMTEDELKSYIYDLYTAYPEDDRIRRNLEYISYGYSYALSDELKAYLSKVTA